MDEKQTGQSFLRVYLGISLLFFGAWIAAVNDNYFYQNWAINTAFFVSGLTISFLIIHSGVSGLRQNGVEVKIDVGNLRNIKNAPILISFVLMTVAIAVAPFYRSETINSGGFISVSYWHPFYFESFILFFSGIGIEFFMMLPYYNYHGAKITEEAPTLNKKLYQP